MHGTVLKNAQLSGKSDTMASRRAKKKNSRLERQVRLANRRIQSMKSQGYGNLTVIDRALKEAKKITGTSEKFTVKGVNSNKKRSILSAQLDKFLNSKWTTESGRKDILEKRINTFMSDGEKGYSMTRAQVLKLFDLFETDEYHKVIEKKMLDSKQMIDIIKKNDDVSSHELEHILSELVKSKTPQGESRLFVEDAIENIEKNREKKD